MRNQIGRKSVRAARRSARTMAACATLSVMLSAGCGDIFSLKQSSTSQIDASTLFVPKNAQLLVNGVIADFECAYTRVVTGMGVLGDEIQNAWAQTNNYDYDRRTVTPSSPIFGGCGGDQLPAFYTGLNTARGAADTTYAALSNWSDEEVPNRAKLMAQAAAYGGYSLIMLGEAMCTCAINLGPELTSAQVFEEARIRFDNAIAAATTANDQTTLNLARLGRARALLNLGKLAEAATDAALIPANFLVGTSPDATYQRRQNIVFLHITQNFRGTVDPSFRNLTLGGLPDPRVRVTNSGRTGNYANTPIWTPDKYPAVTTPVPIAKYAEAQLIIAEARIATGDLTGAAAAINAARNSGGRTGMPQFDATGLTADEVKAQLVEERRREFFLEGHRLWDVRRFDLPLVPAPDTTYPVNNGQYGNQRCFPLPNIERNNNPNL
jgi:starch-binding outer membrane protein, SusD/RagB family